MVWFGSLLAIVFGHIAKNQIDRSGGTQQGRGIAIAGLAIGWISIGVLLFGTVLLVSIRSS